MSLKEWLFGKPIPNDEAEEEKIGPHRFIAVLVPELIEHRWYHYLLHSHTATVLKMMLLFRGGPQVVVISAPWFLRERKRPFTRALRSPGTSFQASAARKLASSST